MKLQSRLEILERTYRPAGSTSLVVDIGGPDGITVDGEFMPRDEYEALYPEGGGIRIYAGIDGRFPEMRN